MKNGKPGLSTGTIVFLSLTAAVICAVVFFLHNISGTDLSAWQKLAVSQAAQDISLNPPVETDLKTQIKSGKEASGTDTGTMVDLTPKHLSICIAGDVTVPRSIRETAVNTAGEPDFTDIFAHLLQCLSHADIAAATLETLTDDGTEYDTYNTSPQILDALKGIGMTHINLATEHMLDLGHSGLEMTRAALNSRGINYCGICEPEPFQMLTVNGVSVAVLAYTYGISDEGMAEKDLSGIPVFSIEQAVRDIVLARARGANLVIVLPHWGTKNSGEVSDQMRETARQLATAGADIIAGAHSNVASEIEMIETERADGRIYNTLVCYSTGALLVDARSEESAAGMILDADIEYDPATRTIRVSSCRAIPLYIYQGIDDGDRVWRVVNLLDQACFEAMTGDTREGALAAKARIEALGSASGGKRVNAGLRNRRK